MWNKKCSQKMRTAFNECGDEKDDLPEHIKLNKNQKTVAPSLLKLSDNSLSRLKRKSNDICLSNDIPAAKKGFCVKPPPVSLTKFNNQNCVRPTKTNVINDKNIENTLNNVVKNIRITNNIKELNSRKRRYQKLKLDVSENNCDTVKQSSETYNFEITSKKKLRGNENDHKDSALFDLNNTSKSLLLSEEVQLQNKLAKIDYISPVRKFFKTNDKNVIIKTVVSGGNCSFRVTRCTKPDLQQHQQQENTSFHFFSAYSRLRKLSTETFVKINQNKIQKINSKNAQNLSLSDSLQSFVENKENFSVSSNKNFKENFKSSEKIDCYKTKFQENYVKDFERNNGAEYLIKTDKIQQSPHNNKKFESGLEGKIIEQNETIVSNLNKIENFLNIHPRERLISNITSMYDRRVQTDDGPANGYTNSNSVGSVRGMHHHNEDLLSSIHSNSVINNHYYPCSPLPQSTMATLCNIGNTCYLNSVVYTLRFAPMFLHNLHHLIDDLTNIQHNYNKYHIKSSSLGRNISGLHVENTRSWSSKDLASLENMSCDMPKSNQQIATEKLHELYQSLRRNEYTENAEPFHADTFLHAIQDVSAIFEGNQQQDAHEFLMCVLDSIRETCQALIKTISECPDAIINGSICLPEQRESSCVVAIPKEKSLQRDTTGSSGIIKTSFFSRKSKRKDAEIKISKNTISINNNNSNTSGNNSRLQSPHRDNAHHQVTSSSSSNSNNTSDGAKGGSINILNGTKHSLQEDLISDKDIINIKDKERLSDKIKKMGLDFFTEDFEGITVSTTKCLSCETITEQKETMIDIAVPITGYENIDLGEKFIQDSCVTKEYFRGENKYRCEQCMGYTEAIRSISYEVLPRLLVIQLSRFSGVMEKINTYLPTPFTLHCFCSKCLGASSPENRNLHVYKLYSVITHVGATMSVGHYIAYTCSLNWANDYINCPKDRMRQAQIIKQKQRQQHGINISSSGSNNTSNTLNCPEKNMKQIKKIIFGRSKASSSGDMSKTVKHLNSLPSLSKSTSITPVTQTNGDFEKQQNNTIDTMNLTCASINCCGLQIRNNYLLNKSNYNNNSSGNTVNTNSGRSSGGYYMDVDDSHQTSIYNSNMHNSSNSTYGTSTQQISYRNRNLQQNEPIWYMCDDDKIKAMSQREFEDMLSPNRKIMITPYLLFYARNDVQ